MQRMRIGLIHKRLDLKGGTERDLCRTAEGLRDLGHEIHLFCSEFLVAAPPGVVQHCVRVLPLGRTSRLWTFALRAPPAARRYCCDVTVGFGRILRQDIVRSGGGSHQGFLDQMASNGGMARRLWQTLSIYHRSVVSIESRQFRSTGYKHVIAVSERVKKELIETYAIPNEKISVLYNGVDEIRFHPFRRIQMRSMIRQRWGIPAEVKLVLFVGSGFRRKGLDRLLAVWRSVRLKDTWLMVVGDDARLPWYKARGESIAAGRIVFVGRQSDIENYYAAADIVALPAVQEAFGNVVLEGLASGLPVLVSKQTGASEVLSGALLGGIVTAPEKTDAVENTLVMLLDTARNPDLCAAARRIGEEYSWKNHFHNLETLLTRIAGSRQNVA